MCVSDKRKLLLQLLDSIKLWSTFHRRHLIHPYFHLHHTLPVNRCQWAKLVNFDGSVKSSISQIPNRSWPADIWTNPDFYLLWQACISWILYSTFNYFCHSAILSIMIHSSCQDIAQNSMITITINTITSANIGSFKGDDSITMTTSDCLLSVMSNQLRPSEQSRQANNIQLYNCTCKSKTRGVIDDNCVNIICYCDY